MSRVSSLPYSGQIIAIDLGDEPARRDGVDAHALEGEFEAQRLGHLDDAGLGGRIGDGALRHAEAQHRGDVDDRALLAGGEHALRRFLRIVEHRVEVGADHAAPFLFADIGGAGRMRDPCVVDQDGDGAERLLDLVECARHRGTVEHVALDGDGLAAGLLDLPLQILEPVGAPRHQRDRCAVRRQHLGEARAEPARCAGDHGDAALEIEDFGGFHGLSFSPHTTFAAAPSQAPARTTAPPARTAGSARTGSRRRRCARW